MGPATQTTTQEMFDERRIERAGEFLHDAPENEASQNPADQLSTFRMPDGSEVQTAVFVPKPAATEAPVTYGGRMEAAARNVAETGEANVALQIEIIHAGDAVYKIRRNYLESAANLN